MHIISLYTDDSTIVYTSKFTNHMCISV